MVHAIVISQACISIPSESSFKRRGASISIILSSMRRWINSRKMRYRSRYDEWWDDTIVIYLPWDDLIMYISDILIYAMLSHATYNTKIQKSRSTPWSRSQDEHQDELIIRWDQSSSSVIDSVIIKNEPWELILMNNAMRSPALSSWVSFNE